MNIWWNEQVEKLSQRARVKFDSWMVEVDKYGLLVEVQSCTEKEFKKIYHDVSHDDKFMRAVEHAMYEWDI
jgi:hypothetical protein